MTFHGKMLHVRDCEAVKPQQISEKIPHDNKMETIQVFLIIARTSDRSSIGGRGG